MQFMEQISTQADCSFTPAGYRLGEVIGIGGMGVVYALNDLADQPTPFVIKMVHPALTNKDQAEAQLRQEAEIELLLQDLPGVVKTLSYSQHPKGHGYKIMRKMSGQSLQRLLQDTKLSRAQACSILLQLIMTMKQVHAKGIVHGDIKPANIFISENREQACIFDFGLACQAYTPLYSSPNLQAGKVPTQADDTYSLMILFLEIVLGQVNLQTQHNAIFNTELEPLTLSLNYLQSLVERFAQCKASQP